MIQDSPKGCPFFMLITGAFLIPMNQRAALALRGYFAISEDGAHESLPLLQATYLEKQKIRAEDLPADEVINFDADDCQEETEAIVPDTTQVSKIIVMNIHGILLHYGTDNSYGTFDYATRLRAYADDETVVGGMLDLDTPGGQVEGTETWGAAVKYFASKKPILGFCEDGKIGSAGMWGAVYCTEIYAGNKLCRFGSIGIMACLIDDSKAMEAYGIKKVVIYAPQSSDKNKVADDALAGKPEAYEADLKFICDYFLNVVSTELAGQLTSGEWKTGKMFFAEDAQRIGLITGIKTRPEVLARIQELSIQYNQSTDMLKRFPKVAELKSAVTAENLEAANLELEDYGITGMTLIADTELAAMQKNEGISAKVTGLETQVATLGTKITGYEASIVEKDQKIAALQAKLDGKPAEDPTDHVPADDKITANPDKKIEASIETSVDRELAEMHAMYKLSI